MEETLQIWNWSSFIFNVLSSLIGSFIFIFTLLFFLRPKFKIIKLIAKQDSPFDETNQICYAFKVVNKSLFSAYDIEARVNYYTLRQGENGIMHKIFHKIELKTSKINYIPRDKLFVKNYGDNCTQFFTYENISEEITKGNKYIQFQITARHSLTGLSNIFTFDFVDSSFIKEGIFVAGDVCSIKKC